MLLLLYICIVLYLEGFLGIRRKNCRPTTSLCFLILCVSVYVYSVSQYLDGFLEQSW